jgi:DNA-binding NtrC family response regulator
VPDDVPVTVVIVHSGLLVETPTLPPSAGGHGAPDADHVPGVIVVFSGAAPSARVMSLAQGPLELGRRDASPGKLDDGRVSRRHARIELLDGRWVVTDLGSQNGSFVDGEPAVAHVPTPAQRVIRIGDSLLVPCADIRPFERAGVQAIDDFVRGPAMRAVLDDTAQAARSGTTLHIRGESGTGKEGVAHAFHRAGARAANALVAVNCANIPHGLAERLLFGVKRGAYSGAEADAPGYVQEADGGTLFLDEVAELEAQVQAKLLRVLEAKEVLPLGASKPRKVDFALCSATSKDLRALVAIGTLREDLYFRIGRPAVFLPALRNRPEEIPALIAHELARRSPAVTAHVLLVEQCLLRPWPGNVRELLSEIRIAAQAARADGNRVTAHHLAASAGSVFGSAAPGSRATPPDSTDPGAQDGPRRRIPQVDEDWRKRIEDALHANAGNVTATARVLGLHRTQLRRLIERHDIAVPAAGDEAERDDDTD